MVGKLERTWDEQRCTRSRVATLQDQMKRNGIGAFLLGGGIGARWTLGELLPAAFSLDDQG